MKTISCGVIIIDKNSRKVLACHPSMKSYKDGSWDIPKGHLESNETHEQAALRELQEEANINLTVNDLYDCGMFLYTKYKDLNLSIAETDVDLTKLSCSTYFYFEGRRPLEIDSYKLVDQTATCTFFHSLGPIIETCLKRYNEEYQRVLEIEEYI